MYEQLPKYPQTTRPERTINGPVQSLDIPSPMRPDFAYTGFEQIDFAQMSQQHGISTLLLDAEGTFVETDGWHVNPSIIDQLNRARETGIQRIAIISNKRPSDDITMLKMTRWADEIGADIVFTPHHAGERKPSPSMFLKAYEYYRGQEIEPSQMLAIGDKLTAEIIAANKASGILNDVGIEGKIRTAWVDRHGDADLVGDRLLRRPIENMKARKMGIAAREERIFWELVKPLLQEAPTLEEIDEMNEDEIDTPINFQTKHRRGMSEGVLDSAVVFEGYGQGPTVELPDEILERIERPRVQVLRDNVVQGVYDTLGEQNLARIDQFLHNHGRLMADILTYSRLPGAVIVAGLILREKYAAACAAHLLFMSTDMLDGPVAGASREGKTTSGGRRDQQNDKVYSVVVEAALAYKGRIGWEDFGGRLTREAEATRRRAHYHEHGVDTSATMHGKLSTNIATYADTIAMFTGGDVSSVMQKLATIDKWASLHHSSKIWRTRHAQNREDLVEASNMLTQLLEEQTKLNESEYAE